MEMPMDILNTQLGKIRDNGDIDFDNTMAAVNIDTILQQKFLSIPYEELEAVEIKESRDGHGYYAGDGPEACKAGEHENPAWLYNPGINALALWWKLKNDQEAAEALAAAEKAQEEAGRLKVLQRPIPGVYNLNTGGSQYTVIVTADRRILAPQGFNGTIQDFTEVYDSLGKKSVWVFTSIETGLFA